MKAAEKIIIALDFPELEKAMELVDLLGEKCQTYKVGSELFTAAGPKVIEKLSSLGKEVFLDLKFHDIPNTVGSSARVCAGMGVKMFNVHASGGSAMMKKAKEESLYASQELGKKPPLVLAVTVLTSMTSDILVDELKILSSAKNQVIHYVRLAEDSGLDGVVCSPFEVKAVREHCSKDFVIVTPGIRPAGSTADDQKRIKPPAEALKDGSDYLVIGRPVTKSDDPLGSLEKILQEISG